MIEYYRFAINKGGEAFAVVMLIRFSRDSYFNFGYKDMDDIMGSFYYQAPKEMLDLLDKYPEPKSGEARMWRQLCREHIARMKSLRSSAFFHFWFHRGYFPLIQEWFTTQGIAFAGCF